MTIANKQTLLVNVVSAIALIIVSSFIFVATDVFWIANIHFWVYLFIMFFSLIKNKSVSLDVVWIIGFIVIVLAEMLFVSSQLENLIVSKYILLGNNIILFSYYCSGEKIDFRAKNYVLINKLWFLLVYFSLLVVYILVVSPKAVLAMRYGRGAAETMYEGALWKTLVSDLSYVLPGLIGFYYKEKKVGWVWSLLFASPVFIILTLCGTRFPLLFSGMSWIIGSGLVKFYNVKRRDILLLVALVLVLFFVSSIMLKNRVSGFDSNDTEKIIDTQGYTVSQKIVSYGSAEGIVSANVWLHDYCRKNGYTYGKQSAFVFYWWIPRKIWPNKPEMTGGWLPHLYGNFGEGHSSSVGLWGELYVDFGYFSFLFLFLFGGILRRMNSYCKFLQQNSNNVNILIAPILVSYAFFAVRSPITGFIALCFSFLVFVFLRFLAFKKVE